MVWLITGTLDRHVNFVSIFLKDGHDMDPWCQYKNIYPRDKFWEIKHNF